MKVQAGSFNEGGLSPAPEPGHNRLATPDSRDASMRGGCLQPPNYSLEHTPDWQRTWLQ